MYRQRESVGRETNCIVSKIFIDTNILVYSIDKREPVKRKNARKVLSGIVDSHQPVISTQVIQEFYVVATTKLKADSVLVKNIIHDFRNMEIVAVDLELIEQAIDIGLVSRLSFWDSMIIAAAEKARCDFVFSEDLSAGQSYRGVVVLNPFDSKSS